jgi:hypothetical protein
LDSSKFENVIPALLLATGRRTTEILKTAVFKKVGEYQLMFDGQLKSVKEAYQIDTLAPANDCIKALNWVRNNIDCVAMTPAEVNLKYGHKTKNLILKLVGLNPHALRGINAMACFQLFHSDEKSMMGYMRHQLGHSSEESTSRYGAYKVTVTKPWVTSSEGKRESKRESKEEAETQPENLIAGTTKPERNKLAQVAEMMRQRKVVNTTSVQRLYGGSHSLIARVLQMNEKVLAKYHAGL